MKVVSALLVIPALLWTAGFQAMAGERSERPLFPTPPVPIPAAIPTERHRRSRR